MSMFGKLRLPELVHSLTHLLAAGVTISFARDMLMVFAVAAALWLWTTLSERRNLAPKPVLRPDYAGHFGFSAEQLRHYRDSQTCIVHHDNAGEIIGIDSMPTTVAPAPIPLLIPVEMPASLPEIAAAA